MSRIVLKKKIYDIVYAEPTPDGVICEKSLFAKMHDGVEIALYVYKPSTGKGPWPVILAYSGYKKEVLFESPSPAFWCPSGNAVVYVRARCTRPSR